MDNYFARLNAIDVSEHLEQKGQFTYLSWPYAVQQLRLADPTATWEVRRFDGLPYLKTETGFFVEVAVTVQGMTLSQIHPVMDAKNRPIPEPTCFDVNSSIQRALVKAIALHGLGLSVYCGEDLPEAHEAPASAGRKPVAPVSELRPPSRATSAQLRYIKRLIEETGSDLDKVLAFFAVHAIDDLSSRQASRAIRSLEKTRRAA
jgi:hypothetical protein